MRLPGANWFRRTHTEAGERWCPSPTPPRTRAAAALTSVPFVDRSQLERGRFGTSFLTCFDVLTRGQMAECAMGSLLVVVDPPRFDSLPCAPPVRSTLRIEAGAMLRSAAEGS